MKNKLIFVLSICSLLVSLFLVKPALAETAVTTARIGVENRVDIKATEPTEEETFLFIIEAKDVNAPMPQSNQLELKGSSKGFFDDITFGNVGEYHYRVYQKAGSDKRYTYDSTVYEVTVYVSYDSQKETLDARITANKVGEEAKREILFQPTYFLEHPQPKTSQSQKHQVRGKFPSTGEIVSSAAILGGVLLVSSVSVLFISKKNKETE
ncbi:LPXTG cell wall anchor domain-containing protein [Streptococcus dysgalactiae subsp. dysgalactiae]|uniref:FctA domain-containing protein n=2 Tax=Streptococcus TaxID=1301 RepID=A0A9X5LX24_STREQ|nr:MULTISPECIES: FctA domain-containing protein [Streptococcus]EGR87703.1 pilin isopeptide linkage domain protein [Streptococcus dysgalactiae subsp. equisimilis SK1250]BAN94206.1 hypothetical protein SDSE167_1830 [Streptococcus dysgalactiae subsp. equisimilis 167]KKC17251.1 pilus assembly protein [Streptococcus dysgalactiae subsp. equisimilis]KKC20694.1 pilus assembly protein [Streptococcus dysgalactiae subsp. equisimilis]KKC22995.1 pilus assembly protein [Streptococcus dysgalactiae subsp. equ